MSGVNCTAAVSSELRALNGPSRRVDLVPAGISTVTVIADNRVTDAQLAATLDKAGDYLLATA